MQTKQKISLFFVVLLLVSPLLVLIPLGHAQTPDKDKIISDLKGYCDAHSSIASYQSIGKTHFGNDIWVFRIGTHSENKILLDGALHGMEVGGSMVIWYLGEWLFQGSAKANAILDNCQVLLMPVVNYDRCSLPNVGDPDYRKNANGVFPLGVDLNRNFPEGWGTSGSGDPTSNYYRGSYVASETETQALMSFWDAEQVDVYVNFHDFGGTDATLGDIRYVNWGGSAYTEAVNEFFNTYASLAIADGLTPIKQIYQSPYGGAYQTAYNYGFPIAANWELTSSADNPWGYNEIYSRKLPHVIDYVYAFSTLSPTPTPSPTISPSPTPTTSPTPTPTPSPTPTPTPTASPTPTPTPTLTPTSTPTPTQNPAPTPSTTVTPTPSQPNQPDLLTYAGGATVLLIIGAAMTLFLLRRK